MTKIFAFLRLVRFVNLLIIAMAMFFFQYFLIAPILSFVNESPSLSPLYFSLLVLATVAIAAAGNVLNDYYDFEADSQYKPERVVLWKYFSLDTAIYIVGILNVLGIGLGFYVSWHIGYIKQGNIFLLAAVLLGVYSMVLKKYPLIGNIVIAMLSGFVFCIVVYFEHKFLMDIIDVKLYDKSMQIYTQMLGYFAFAFWVSLMREIIKDAEDKEGDAANGISTLGTLLPTWALNAIVFVMLLILMGGVGYLQSIYWQTNNKNYFYYALFFLQFPMLLQLLGLLHTSTQKDYHNYSVQLKLLMFFGIATLPVFYFFTLH